MRVDPAEPAAVSGEDTRFAGSIPAVYEACLGPLLFRPYGRDLAARAAALQPGDVLETAAGTGIVTEALAAALPDARIVATDLNPAMIDIAAAKPALAGVAWQAADAQALPFADGSFDLVACQFGIMFMPDKPRAAAEALRVLRPGGAFLLNVWGPLEENVIACTAHDALARHLPHQPPTFLARAPHGYHDRAQIEADLRAGGFTEVEIGEVRLTSRVDPAQAARGFCQGSPVHAEIVAATPEGVEGATAAVAEALQPYAGRDMPMLALVVTAR